MSAEREMILADHAEAWQRERGREVPDRDSEAYRAIYDEWIEFAFEFFPNNEEGS